MNKNDWTLLSNIFSLIGRIFRHLVLEYPHRQLQPPSLLIILYSLARDKVLGFSIYALTPLYPQSIMTKDQPQSALSLVIFAFALWVFRLWLIDHDSVTVSACGAYECCCEGVYWRIAITGGRDRHTRGWISEGVWRGIGRDAGPLADLRSQDPTSFTGKDVRRGIDRCFRLYF